jgi:hypothetical protein
MDGSIAEESVASDINTGPTPGGVAWLALLRRWYPYLILGIIAAIGGYILAGGRVPLG